MRPEELKPNITLYGPLFPEPVRVIITLSMGSSVKLVGKGVRSNAIYEPILSPEQLAHLTASPAEEPFDADAAKFRLGVEAMRLGLAYLQRGQENARLSAWRILSQMTDLSLQNIPSGSATMKLAPILLMFVGGWPTTADDAGDAGLVI
jgi:hypothetical protein